MMKIAKYLSTAAIGVAASILLVAGPASAETLSFGYIGPMTGGGAPWGIAGAEGARIAIDDVNAKGGIKVGGKTYQVKLIAYDDKYTAADDVAVYNRLVHQDDVKFLVVLTGTGTLALKDNIEADKVVAFTATYTDKALTEKTKYLFRVYAPPRLYMEPVVKWMKQNLPGKNVVLLNPNDEVGWDGEETAKKGFTEGGYDLRASERFERNLKDFQPLLTRIIAMQPDIIDLGATAPATSGIIVRQARELGYKKLFVKTGGAALKEILDAAGREAAEGTINLLWADRTQSGFRRVAEEYKKAKGQEPNEMIVPIYDAVRVTLAAIEKAGTVEDTDKVAATVKEVFPYTTLQGDQVTLGGFNSNGTPREIESISYIGAIKNGEIAVIGKAK